ncbi:HK97 gp10 family phage protein [Paenibacillus eucommiae]|uniref:Uncharacterized protein n=1 Tax=Paenibacillus eucommiae TaxID=1355755 RepID=A0ABS4IRL4_9BACL|nr:HK97 gp10 family phage protein [Paenibacillus eucommiae]MBP1990214.1 hypothetical protein [Paenibacillus eucommiae]
MGGETNAEAAGSGMSQFGDFKFKEMHQLEQQLKRMQADVPLFFEQCLMELASRLLAKAVARTPAEAEELRRGWKIGNIRRSGNEYQVEVLNSVAGEDGALILTLTTAELEGEIAGIIQRKMMRFLERYLGR